MCLSLEAGTLLTGTNTNQSLGGQGWASASSPGPPPPPPSLLPCEGGAQTSHRRREWLPTAGLTKTCRKPAVLGQTTQRGQMTQGGVSSGGVRGGQTHTGLRVHRRLRSEDPAARCPCSGTGRAWTEGPGGPECRRGRGEPLPPGGRRGWETPLRAGDVVASSKPEHTRRPAHLHTAGRSPRSNDSECPHETRVCARSQQLSPSPRNVDGHPPAHLPAALCAQRGSDADGDEGLQAGQLGASLERARLVSSGDTPDDCSRVTFSKRPHGGAGGRPRGCWRLRRGDAVAGQPGPEIACRPGQDTRGHRSGEQTQSGGSGRGPALGPHTVRGP